jgi:hypothetical protein
MKSEQERGAKLQHNITVSTDFETGHFPRVIEANGRTEDSCKCGEVLDHESIIVIHVGDRRAFLTLVTLEHRSELNSLSLNTILEYE